jgi:NAD+ dependent glucose-6-phosphate dehydrogenase
MTEPVATKEKRKVLITGAAGFIGSYLRRLWGDRYTLRLADINPVGELESHEEFVQLDITDLEAFTSACQGIDTVVHLAADPRMDADFYDSLLQRNIIGGYNGFEAARQAGCRRLIFASSINAILGYGGEKTVEWDVPVFPQNVYGATKCWGEALARVYADQHGLSCICVRIGGASWTPKPHQENPDKPHMGFSSRDGAQLFGLCVDAEDLDFAIVHGISKHRRGWMSLEYTQELLGYQPQDDTTSP